jgi:hypothetical protein
VLMEEEVSPWRMCQKEIDRNNSNRTKFMRKLREQIKFAYICLIQAIIYSLHFSNLLITDSCFGTVSYKASYALRPFLNLLEVHI